MRGAALNPLERFAETGFAGPFELCTAARMNELRPHLTSVLACAPAHGNATRNRHLDSTLVRDLALDAAIADRVAALSGPDLLLWRTNFFVKAPGAKEIPWHQDWNYWPLEPAIVVSAWIAIDDATRENGCVEVIPGSHHARARHVPVAAGMNEDFQEMADPDAVDRASAQPLELRAGEFFLFNERTVHRSAANRSSRTRIGLAVRVIVPAVDVLSWDSADHRLVLMRGNDRPGADRVLPAAVSPAP